MPQQYIPCISMTDPRIQEPKHRLNEARLLMTLKNLQEKQREELLSMTWEEIFELAAMSEGHRKTLPAYDIAFSHFSNQEHQMLKLAELMQIRDQYKHLLT